MSPILFKRSPIWSHWFAPFASSTFDDDIISSRVSNGAILQTYFRLSLWHCVDIMINFGCRLLWAMLKARSDNYEHYKEAKSFQNFTLLCSSHHCIFAADFDESERALGVVNTWFFYHLSIMYYLMLDHLNAQNAQFQQKLIGQFLRRQCCTVEVPGYKLVYRSTYSRFKAWRRDVRTHTYLTRKMELSITPHLTIPGVMVIMWQ